MIERRRMNIMEWIAVVVCGLIFWQDVRERAVYWVLFPVLFVLGLLNNYSVDLFQEWLLSLSLLGFLLGFLTLYLSLKNGRLINITKGFFCWGDILFLLASIPFFFSVNYLYFFTFGTVCTLLIHLIIRNFWKQETVPYAGYMAIILGVVLFLDWNVEQFILQV